MLTPENFHYRKTSLLNLEIHNKVNDPATNRDKFAQRKQRLVIESTIPLVKAAVALKELECDTQDKIPRDIKSKLQDVSPFLHKCLRCSLGYKEKEKVAFGNP